MKSSVNAGNGTPWLLLAGIALILVAALAMGLVWRSQAVSLQRSKEALAAHNYDAATAIAGQITLPPFSGQAAELQIAIATARRQDEEARAAAVKHDEEARAAARKHDEEARAAARKHDEEVRAAQQAKSRPAPRVATVAVPQPRKTVIQEMDDADTQAEADDASPSATVRRYYNLLNKHQFAEAYALLSPDFRRASPFETWKAGYRTTIFTDADVDDTNDPTNVPVTITAKDATSSGVVTTTFEGKWKLVPSESGGWYLDTGIIHKVPSN